MTFDELKSTADTRGKACPHLLGDPCKGRDCAFWMRDTVTNDVSKPTSIEGCMYILQYFIGRDTCSETMRLVATVDKVAKYVDGQTSMLAMVGRTMAQIARRPLGDGPLEVGSPKIVGPQPRELGQNNGDPQ